VYVCGCVVCAAHACKTQTGKGRACQAQLACAPAPFATVLPATGCSLSPPPPSLGSRGHPPRRAFLPSALPGFPPGPARVRASVRGLRTNGMRTRTTRASVPARRLRVRVARGAQRFCFSWRQLRSGGASQAEATVRNCTKRTVVWWWGARTRWQK
jgi:hypothetical protein